MMGKRMPETCWTVFEWRAINLRDWCICLVDLFEWMPNFVQFYQSHGLTRVSAVPFMTARPSFCLVESQGIEHYFGHSCTSRGDVKTAWCSSSTPPYTSMALCLKEVQTELLLWHSFSLVFTLLNCTYGY